MLETVLITAAATAAGYRGFLAWANRGEDGSKRQWLARALGGGGNGPIRPGTTVQGGGGNGPARQ